MNATPYWLHPNSIQSRMFVSILVFLIIPTLITFHYMGESLERSVEGEINASQGELMSLVAGNLQLTTDNMINALIAASYDQNMIKMLNKHYMLNEYEKMKTSDNIMTTLTNTYLANLKHYITIMDFTDGLYTNWYAPYGTYEELKNEQWFDEVSKSRGQLIWLRHEEGSAFKNKEALLSVATIVQGRTTEGYGIVMISIPIEELRSQLQVLQGDSLLVDRSNQIIAGTDKQLANEQLLETVNSQSGGSGTLVATIHDTAKSVHYQLIKNTDWTIIQIVSNDVLFKDMDQIRKFNTLLIVIIFFLYIVISFSISNRISRPLRLLNKKIASMEASDFNSYIPAKGMIEVAGLIHTYNNMLHQIKALLVRLKAEYQLKEQLRFKMLQAQINPHFILNTLSNVKWMAYMRKADEVGDMLSSLGAILEASLGKNTPIISLHDEIEYIRNYVILQKIKYNEKLVVEFFVPDELLHSEIIRFILQPIVENAIYHGIEKKQGTGHIMISARREDNQLLIEIKDDGIGMDANRLEYVRNTLADCDSGDVNDTYKSIGLVNVHQRIRLHYGPSYGIDIASEESSGTCVRIVLPYLLENGGEEHV